MEPVTKIDVDSDDEIPQKSTAQIKKQSTAENGSNKSENTTTTASAQNRPATTPKRIKLKRNFRKRSQEEDENEIATETLKENVMVFEKEIKEEKRSHSPDVIPIVTETETLYISDSSCEEKTEKSLEKSQQHNNEKLISSEKQEQTVKEVEDGEINDEESCNAQEENLIPVVATQEKEEVEKSSLITENADNNTFKETETLAVLTDEKEVAFDTDKDVITDKSETKVDCQKEQTITEDTNISKVEVENPADEIDNDDIISIEGGDLETEMSEHLIKEDKSEVKKCLKNSENKESEVISLDDSSDEDCRAKLNRKRSEVSYYSIFNNLKPIFSSFLLLFFIVMECTMA